MKEAKVFQVFHIEEVDKPELFKEKSNFNPLIILKIKNAYPLYDRVLALF